MSKRVRFTPPPAPVAPSGVAQAFAPPSVPATPVARRVAELGAFPAYLLTGLPAATSMLCRTAAGAPCLVTTGARDFEAARVRGVAAFAGDEWAALLVAAQQDRAVPFALDHWVAEKRAAPTWQLTLEVALAGLLRLEPRDPHASTQLTVAAVLRAYGATLVLVPAEYPATAEDWAALGAGSGAGTRGTGGAAP